MKTIPTKQNNEKQTIIHTFETKEKEYPFAILEEIETTENDEINSTFEVICGNNKISEKQFKSYIEAHDYLMSKPYELILGLIVSVLDAKDKFDKEQVELLKHKQNEVQQ